MRTGRWRISADRNVLLFVGISLLSGFGGTSMIVVSGVWVLELSGSSSLAALTGLCLFAPTLLGPALGALVDRLPRRRLIVWTHLVTAGAVLSLLAVRTEAQIWLVYLVMLGYGTSLVLIDAGETALLPAALPPDELGGVNGLRMSAQEGMKLVAPLVGAALFTWRGGHPVAVLTAGVLAVAAGLYPLLRIRTGSASLPQPGTPRGTSGRMRAGIAFLWRHPELRTTVLVGSMTIGLSGLITAAVYAVVTRDLHQPAAFIGVLSSGQGAGSLLGGLVVGRLLRTGGTRAVGALGATLFAIGAAGYCIPWWPASIASAVVVGIGLPWTLVAAVTAVQSRTPEALLGRVAGTANTLLFAPVAVTTPVGAALVLLDHRLPLLVATMLCLAVGLVAIRSARRARPAGTLDGAPASAPLEDIRVGS